MNALGEICGFIGGFIGVATALPQFFRIRALGHSAGLALSPWLLMFAQFAAWTAFGLKVDSPSITIANLLTALTTVLVIVAITGSNFKNWLLILLGSLGVGTFVFFGPVTMVDWAMILLTGARLPQLIRTWFSSANLVVSAVSIPSMLVAVSSMVFWLAFAVLTAKPLVALTTTIGIAITLLTAVVEMRNTARTAKVVA